MKGMMFSFWACVVAVPICTQIMPGVHAENLLSGVAMGAILGVVMLIVRPLLRLLTLPIGCLTLGLSGWLIDIGLVYFCSGIVPGFYVESFGWAVAVAMFASLLGALANMGARG